MSLALKWRYSGFRTRTVIVCAYRHGARITFDVGLTMIIVWPTDALCELFKTVRLKESLGYYGKIEISVSSNVKFLRLRF